MVKFITRRSMDDTLNFLSNKMSFDAVVKNLNFITPITLLSGKVEGNDDYRDITTREIDENALVAAISRVYKDTNVTVMVLKSDQKNRIAFVFDNIPGNVEAFSDEFGKSLKEANINFKKGWMEDPKNLVYIIQL